MGGNPGRAGQVRDQCWVAVTSAEGSGAIPCLWNTSAALRQQGNICTCSCKVIFRRIMLKNSEPAVTLLIQVPNWRA